MSLSFRKNEIPPEKYDEYLRSGYRRNFVVNTLDMSFFQFGWSAISLADRKSVV